MKKVARSACCWRNGCAHLYDMHSSPLQQIANFGYARAR
jgi:hypothetical protein